MPLDEATLNEMAAHYSLLFPQYPPLQVSRGWLMATFLCGNDYRNKAALYGAFPRGVLERLLACFPDYDSKTTLQVFSGAVDSRFGTRFDLSPEFKPDVQGNAEELSKYFPDRRFKLIVADPPYTRDDAKRYALPFPNKRKVVAECAKVLEPGGVLAWLDCSWPMWKRTELNVFGLLTIIVGSNHRVRAWTLFQKV